MKPLTCSLAIREQITCRACKFGRACLDKIKVNGEPAGFKWWGDKTMPVKARVTNPPTIIEHVLASGDVDKVNGLRDVLASYNLQVRDIMDGVFSDRKRSNSYSW